MDREVGQLYTVARAVLDPLFAFLWRIEVEGRENVPDEGGAILAPNHLSVLDHFVLATTLPRRITYVGKAEYMDDWKTKYIFPALGMIPIDRGGGSAANRALEAAARVLEPGRAVRHLPRGHPLTGRQAAQGPHRRGPPGHAHGLPDHPGRAAGHPRGAAARLGRSPSRSR